MPIILLIITSFMVHSCVEKEQREFRGSYEKDVSDQDSIGKTEQRPRDGMDQDPPAGGNDNGDSPGSGAGTGTGTGDDNDTIPENPPPKTNKGYKKPSPHKYPDDYNNQNTAPNKILLTFGEKPASEIRIAFSAKNAKNQNSGTIYLSKTQRNGDTSAYEIKKEAENNMGSTCSGLPFFSANIKDLDPYTTYYFVLELGSEKTKEMHFMTAPANDQTSFKLLAGGDSRSNINKRIQMNKQLATLFENDANYLALVHGGDFISDGEECDQWEDWLDNHQHTMTPSGRVLPVIATFGNHETGGEDIYSAIFGDPKGNGDFYFHSSFGGINLVILNSEISVEGRQKDWLSSTLKELSSEKAFTIPSYHRPAYPGQKSPGSTTAWVPLFEENKVRLVLESDGHILKQTCPILNDKCREGGVIYVGEGGLGVDQRSADRKKEWYFENGGYAKSQHHVQSIELIADDNGPKDLVYQVYYDNSFRHRIKMSLAD